jgi:hypothetical protein
MLVALKPGADFSARCALSGIRSAFLLTYPRRLTYRESTPAMASSSKIERGRLYIVCPVRSIRYMRRYAISSSTSWSRRSSMLWVSPSLPFLRAHSR